MPPVSIGPYTAVVARATWISQGCLKCCDYFDPAGGCIGLLPNICTEKVDETRDFYAELLGFVVGFEHQGWYVQMASPVDPKLQIGIVRLDHAFTPKAFQQPAQGVIISAQVEDVGAAYAAVRKRGFHIAHELCDESFGMRRFMVADPNGLLVNVFSFP